MDYYKHSDYLRKRFGVKVHKVSVDAGFACPNRDGKISRTGCIYCDNKAFNFQSRSGHKLSIEEQIETGMAQARKRFKAEKFIVYFQANTNTYASLEELKDKYNVVKKFKDVVSISIATRPDCVDKDILNLISGYARDYEVWIEYGLQSIHDKTLEFINRGHNYDAFLKAFALTREYPVRVCVHVILGLPGETEDMMMKTATEVARLKIDAIKIHPLHIVRGTVLEKVYQEGACTPLGLEEYSRLLKEFIKRLPSDVIVQRLSAYCPKDILVAPAWVSERHVF